MHQRLNVLARARRTNRMSSALRLSIATPLPYKFRVFTSSQKRRVTPQIKRERKRRSAVEPVIGHLKSGHRMGRNFLAHQQGDAINPVLTAAGYNFRLILKWFRSLWLQIWMIALGCQEV